MLSCWIEDPNSQEFKLHIPRIYDYLWVAEDGMKMQVIFCAVLDSVYIYFHLRRLLQQYTFSHVLQHCKVTHFQLVCHLFCQFINSIRA